MPQEILRTEDFIESLDTKVHASEDHPQIDVLADETYPSIIEKISNLVCSLSEKLALNQTLTSPSATNPIVLKDDIETYYPQDDLGALRDAVNDIGDLPLSGNNLNDLRPVLNIGAIYRWDGSGWVVFIKTGTIDHTQLIEQNDDSNFLHVTLSELSSLSVQSHSHPNPLILDGIITSGSGIIISNVERGRLPSSDEKAALQGSVYSPPTDPSSTNRYVTSVDPRLNTVKNPYVTFGLSGSGTTFQGDTIADLQIAMDEIATGINTQHINALEILPATYLNDEINYQGIAWLDNKPFLLEALASRQTRLQIYPQPDGSIGFHIASGDGQVTIRGITFEFGSNDLVGVLIERDNTIFEDCTFTTATTPIPLGNLAVRINANKVNLRRCVFNGNLYKGIEVLGDQCFIENCRFDLNDSSYPAIEIMGNQTQVTSCIISQGALFVDAVSDTIFDKNRLSSLSPFTDLGSNTRWLGSVPPDFQQAYIGKTRTVGGINSHADFRGTNEIPFLAALADPYTTEIEILEGTYTFSAPVSVPEGKSLKVVRRNAVLIQGTNCFILNSSSRLAGVNLSVAVGGIGISSSFSYDVEVKDCIINVMGSDSINHYGISFSNNVDSRVERCKFYGTRGIKISDGVRNKISNNVFTTTVFSTETLNSLNLHYIDNIEENSVCSLSIINGLVQGNQFIGAVPTKINTSNTLWTGNYPEAANNHKAIDTLLLSTNGLSYPILNSGASLSSFLGTASIAFLETGTPTIVTPPIFLKEKINRAQGFDVILHWTSTVFSGDVKWEASVVFRDRDDLISDLGTPTVKTVLSTRSHLTVREEEIATISFLSSDYGYIAGVNPSHVSIILRRLGDDSDDTMGGIAYLTEMTISFSRD